MLLHFDCFALCRAMLSYIIRRHDNSIRFLHPAKIWQMFELHLFWSTFSYTPKLISSLSFFHWFESIVNIITKVNIIKYVIRICFYLSDNPVVRPTCFLASSVHSILARFNYLAARNASRASRVLRPFSLRTYGHYLSFPLRDHIFCLLCNCFTSVCFPLYFLFSVLFFSGPGNRLKNSSLPLLSDSPSRLSPASSGVGTFLHCPEEKV